MRQFTFFIPSRLCGADISTDICAITMSDVYESVLIVYSHSYYVCLAQNACDRMHIGEEPRKIWHNLDNVLLISML